MLQIIFVFAFYAFFSFALCLFFGFFFQMGLAAIYA